MPIVLIPFELTKSELRRVSFFVQLRYYYWIVWLVFALVGLSYFFSPEPRYYGLGIFLITYVPILIALITEWGVTKSKVLKKSISITLDGDFLQIALSSGSESKNSLSDFFRIREVAGYVLLYVNRASFFMIPDRAFRTHEDKAAFWKICSEHMPAGKRAKN